MFPPEELKPTETVCELAYADLVKRVEAHIGIRVHSTLFSRLKVACDARMQALGLDRVSDYVALLGDDLPEWLKLIPVVSVGESYFYRDSDRWQALSEHVLPALFSAAAKGNRMVRILSVGCSTGEEVYGLAAVCERVGFVFPGVKVDVLGVDVDAEAIAAAQKGVYTDNSLRGLSPERFATLFLSQEPPFRVRDGLRRLVRFETRNLVAWSQAEAPQPEFDLILCQNVVIYFARQTTEQVVDTLAAAVRPGGMLVMGHSEVLALPNGFSLASVGSSYCFRKDFDVPSKSRDWCLKPSVSSTVAERASKAAWAAVEQEDYVAAKQALKTVDLAPEARHLLAWIHCCLGDLHIARRLVDEVLAVASTKPEPHFVRGVLAQADDDVATARDCFRHAVFLDPSFAAAHFHLAEAQCERGRDDLALRSWRNAVQSAYNDQTRVRRYGGGFDVSTFVQACEARVASVEALG